MKEWYESTPASVNSIRNDYFSWLYDLVYLDNNHWLLLGLLHGVEFTWSVDMDQNRAIEGVNLRSEFADTCDYFRDDVGAALSGPCTVLEMLVAMCRRCEDDIMYDPKMGDRTAVWFWDIISNLGLLEVCDDGYFDENFVLERVRMFIERRFHPDQEGCPFLGIKYTDYEVKNTEFWSMMQSYLLMKYGNI